MNDRSEVIMSFSDKLAVALTDCAFKGLKTSAKSAISLRVATTQTLRGAIEINKAQAQYELGTFALIRRAESQAVLNGLQSRVETARDEYLATVEQIAPELLPEIRRELALAEDHEATPTG